MKLVKQVCSLEQAKRLKELGVYQSSIWVWVFPSVSKMFSTTNGIYYHLNAKEIIEDNSGDEFDHDSAAAFTVAELGEMLLCYGPIGHSFFNDVRFTIDEKAWAHTWSNKRYESQPVVCWYKTEAEARAAMLILLLETKLITAGEVNERLKEVV